MLISESALLNLCVREPGSCPQTGYLKLFGTASVKKQVCLSKVRMFELGTDI